MKKTCRSCGGTGQLGYFQGVSRFIITWEECPDCAGSGLDSLEQSNSKENPCPEKKESPEDVKKQQ